MVRRKVVKRRRRRTKVTNVLDVAQTVIVANAITRGLFNTNLYGFITGQTGKANAFGADGARTMSIPEWLGIGENVDFGGNYGSSSFTEAISKSWSMNWPRMLVMTTAVPIIFSIAKKNLAKSVINPTNRILKNVGVTGFKL